MKSWVLDIETLLAPGDKPDEPNWCVARAEIVCIATMPSAAGDDAYALWTSTKLDFLSGYVSGMHSTEAGLLADFNAWFEREVNELVTFNGRGFDLPCLVHRSAALGVKPARKLLNMVHEPRYKPFAHVDVRERFTFQGASNRGSLQDFAIAYGVADPKAGGDGSKVEALVAARDAEKLGAYCLGDVRATKELWLKWQAMTGAR